MMNNEKDRSDLKQMKRNALKAAFPLTIPVLTGYLCLGMGFGVLMSTIGYGISWTILMSVFVFAGSIQYIAITLLAAAFSPLYVLFLTIMVNARHLFYGIAMLEKFKGAGKLKPYLIFGLTDETFSLLSTKEPPEGVERKWFQLFVTLLDHSYWVAGSAIGAVVGALLDFNTKGLSFALTALFVVIFIEQWASTKNHLPALIGIGATAFCLVLFGQTSFMIPAMALILALLTVFRKRIEERAEK